MNDYYFDTEEIKKVIDRSTNNLENMLEPLYTFVQGMIECIEEVNSLEGLVLFSNIAEDVLFKYNTQINDIKLKYEHFKNVFNDYEKNVDSVFYKGTEEVLKKARNIKPGRITVESDYIPYVNIDGQWVLSDEERKVGFYNLFVNGPMEGELRKKYYEIRDKEKITFEEYIDRLFDSGDIQYTTDFEEMILGVVDNVPGVSDVKKLLEVFSGRRFLSGEEISDADRIAGGIDVVLATVGYIYKPVSIGAKELIVGTVKNVVKSECKELACNGINTLINRDNEEGDVKIDVSDYGKKNIKDILINQGISEEQAELLSIICSKTAGIAISNVKETGTEHIQNRITREDN